MQVEFFHSLEHSSGFLSVGSIIRGEDKEVIYVDDEPPFSDEVPEQIVDELLDHGRGIHESKEHDCEFQEPFMGYKGGFPLVSIFDSDIVVSLVDIELGKNLCSLELINKVRDEEKGVGVPNGIFIQVAIVLEWMNCHPSF